jgi:hypothetical protein
MVRSVGAGFCRDFKTSASVSCSAVSNCANSLSSSACSLSCAIRLTESDKEPAAKVRRIYSSSEPALASSSRSCAVCANDEVVAAAARVTRTVRRSTIDALR